jgi:hypothetical protein
MSEEYTEINLDPKSLPSHGLFAQKAPDFLYHYTSLEGANGIITSRSFWLTKLAYANDSSELNLPLNLLREELKIRANETADEDKKNFLRMASQRTESYHNTNICVASLCENGDLLSQWRGYGGNASGVSLSFESAKFYRLAQQNRLRLWKCVYEPTQHKSLIREFSEMLLKAYCIIEKTKKVGNWEACQQDLLGYFYASFLRVAPVFKNSHFQEEKEWRLVTNPISSRDKNYHARITNTRCMEYFQLNFDEIPEVKKQEEYHLIKEVIIGPSRDSSFISGALGVQLRKYGHKISVILPSRIPFRSV